MNLQNLLSDVRYALNVHNMINDGDKIAVGLSGGKDSMSLLYALSEYKKFAKEQFELCAVMIDMGFKNADFSPIKDFCENTVNTPLKIVKTDIAEILFEIRKEKNPCSLCSKIRRGALNSAIVEMGYNKLALGHNSDDLTETFFLSMFYEGRLSVFQPTSYMDRTKITLIRPLIYVEEKNTRAFAKNYNLPIYKNPCTANGNTRRESVKQIIKNFRNLSPDIPEKIFRAITHPDRNNLWNDEEINKDFQR